MKRLWIIVLLIVAGIVLIAGAFIGEEYLATWSSGSNSGNIGQYPSDAPGEGNGDSGAGDVSPDAVTAGSEGAGSGGSTENPVRGGGGADYGGRGAYLSAPEGLEEEEVKHTCEQELNCTASDEGVCGWMNPMMVSCSEGPCVQRYANYCEACEDERVMYWSEGDCPFHDPLQE